MEDRLQQRVWQLENVVSELNKSLIYWRLVYDGTQLEANVREWVSSRIGKDHNSPQERAMRLLEEAVELAQAEGIPLELVTEQVRHVYGRPSGTPEGEAPGVAVCLYGYCASRGMQLTEIAQKELERIESVPQESIRKSLQRKADAGLLTTGKTHTPEMEELCKHYVISDPLLRDRLERYRPEWIKSLLTVIEPLKRFFGSDTVFRIRVSEGTDPNLDINIEWPGNVDDITSILNQFMEEWWLPHWSEMSNFFVSYHLV